MPLADVITYLLGGRRHIASCGTFGGNEMLGILRDVNGLSFESNPFSFVLFLIGVLLVFLFPISLS